MMKWGAFNGAADLRKVAQSLELVGEKIFMPLGQLFGWVDFETERHSVHLTSLPGL